MFILPLFSLNASQFFINELFLCHYHGENQAREKESRRKNLAVIQDRREKTLSHGWVEDKHEIRSQVELTAFGNDSLGEDEEVKLKMTQRFLSQTTGRVGVPKRNKLEQRVKRDTDNELRFRHVEFKVTARLPWFWEGVARAVPEGQSVEIERDQR